MIKKLVSLKSCCEGNVVAGDVLNNQGVPLVVESTVINPYIKEKLTKMKVGSIWIYESHQIPLRDKRNNRNNSIEDITKAYIDNVESIKIVLNDLSSGKGLDEEKIHHITKSIYSWIYDYDKVLQVLSQVKACDEYTYNHSINTAFYSMLMARWLKLSKDDMEKVIQAGLLHDVGKIKICNEILNKKGKLSLEEFKEIEKHPLYGYAIVQQIKSINEDVRNTILGHHERIDGSGYPLGAKGEEINLYTKIISIADVYDAMVSDRIYKKRTSPFEVFQMFLTSGIGAFDPTVLRVFISHIATYYIGAEVALSSGKTGRVVFVPPYDVANPIIHVDSGYVDLSKKSDMKILCII